LTISITAFGRVPPGQMVRRSGARIGDHIAVTGTIGDAAAGLGLLQGASGRADLNARDHDFLVGRYREPQPRVALSSAVRSCASAAMDVSDGLVGDLAKLCDASGVGAEVNAPDGPFSDAARALIDAGGRRLDELLSGGDDYEILCTVPPVRWDTFNRLAAGTGIAVTRIGTVTEETGSPRFLDGAGERIAFARSSFSHF
jgi:thiamine-monophosphate kinase